jgi:hypothetical protein
MVMYSYCMFMYGFPDRFFRAFSSVVRQMPGYTLQRQARSALLLINELCCSMHYLCRLCRSIYCLCVYMCTVLLPPGGYQIAVKCIISYHIGHPAMALSYSAFAVKFGNCKVFTLQSQAYLMCGQRREM